MNTIDLTNFKIKQFKRGEKVAPHKPLLILLALARLQQGEPRLLSYQELEPDLKELLLKYSNSKSAPHPEFPFWRLRTDMEGNFWEIPGADLLNQNASGDVRPADLIGHKIKGGFSPAVFEKFKDDSAFCSAFGQTMLDEYFPDSLHEDLKKDLGLLTSWYRSSVRRKRDPRFSKIVLELYRYKCAVCHYSARLGHAPFGVEAAHVKWHAYNGPDDPENGIALCAIHHKAFDCGAIGLTDDSKIIVSKTLNGSENLVEIYFKFEGKSVYLPSDNLKKPHIAYIRWHRREVFRS